MRPFHAFAAALLVLATAACGPSGKTLGAHKTDPTEPVVMAEVRAFFAAKPVNIDNGNTLSFEVVPTSCEPMDMARDTRAESNHTIFCSFNGVDGKPMPTQLAAIYQWDAASKSLKLNCVDILSIDIRATPYRYCPKKS